MCCFVIKGGLLSQPRLVEVKQRYNTGWTVCNQARRPQPLAPRAWWGLWLPAARVAGAPSCVGCSVPSNAACSFNYSYYYSHQK